MVGDGVSAMVVKILQGSSMKSSLNSTFIALKPKKCNSQFVTDYRPISLYNVISKLASKDIVNRLKPCMDLIISISQSTFIPRRFNTDNIIIAHELLHKHSKMKWNNGKMDIKVDMSKAYDRVKWPYLLSTMRAMGFIEKWINLVMSV